MDGRPSGGRGHGCVSVGGPLVACPGGVEGAYPAEVIFLGGLFFFIGVIIEVMENEVSKKHYYGDEVRRFFLAGAFIMTAALPFIHAFIGQPVVFSVLAILILVVAAGLTNPKQLPIAAFNALIAAAAVIVFELYAVSAYGASGIVSLFFWLNQILAVDFLVALYFGVKTIRGKLV